MIEKLLQDPEWSKVEAMIEEFTEKVLDIRDIDLTQPAEHVKAELIGRIKSYDSMTQFLQDTKIVSKPTRTVKNPFR